MAQAAEQGVLLYTIGFGSPEGEPIPEYNAAGEVVGFKKDQAVCPDPKPAVTAPSDQISIEKSVILRSSVYHNEVIPSSMPTWVNDTEYLVKVRARDNALNLSNPISSFTFTYDNVPSTVGIVHPIGEGGGTPRCV